MRGNMTHKASKSTVILALGAATLALAACDVRRDADGTDADTPVVENPDATPSPDPSASPSETATPVASILREDMEQVEEVALPTQPFEATIPFPDNGELSERAERLLAGVMRSDAMGEDWPVILGGHTDSSGNDAANLRASRARAEEVAAWLIERGVDDERIEVIAFGEQNPAEPNANPDGTPNEAGRRANRRVEISIAPPEPEPAPERNLITKGLDKGA